ncbi:hypothetical protein LCGC14_2231880 [marine sediment metagenome]|uniref:Uncharacterized protein n=1 Tax=marine sediment metagenome TaxID=412755 RepID=A0A0F9FKL5_9ZZZZ
MARVSTTLGHEGQYNCIVESINGADPITTFDPDTDEVVKTEQGVGIEMQCVDDGAVTFYVQLTIDELQQLLLEALHELR